MQASSGFGRSLRKEQRLIRERFNPEAEMNGIVSYGFLHLHASCIESSTSGGGWG